MNDIYLFWQIYKFGSLNYSGKINGTGTSCKENFQTGFVVAGGGFLSYWNHQPIHLNFFLERYPCAHLTNNQKNFKSNDRLISCLRNKSLNLAIPKSYLQIKN